MPEMPGMPYMEYEGKATLVDGVLKTKVNFSMVEHGNINLNLKQMMMLFIQLEEA